MAALSVYFIKRSCILETTFPDFIDDSAGMFLILDPGSRHHTQCRSPSHTVLQLLCNAPLVLGEELAHESAFAAQGAGTDFQASLVAQIVCLHLELQVVPSMHHFVGHGVFLMPSVSELVRTQQDSMIETEASALLVGTHTAEHVLVVDVAAKLRNLVLEEAHHGRVLK